MTDPTPDRPLVTFALFAYNQEKYIREAVEGAFSQTYEPLEIILSDDCSSDRTFEIMQEMAATYDGPHDVKVRQGPKNLGVARHFDTLIRLSGGTFFVAAAGDDVSDPARTELSVGLAQKIKNLGFVEVKCKNFSGDFRQEQQDVKPKEDVSYKHQMFSIEDVLVGNITGLTGAGRTYRRDAYVRFSPLIEGCPAEDTPALFRCLYGGAGAFLKVQLVSRRIHDNNLSSQESLSRMNMDLLASQYYQDLDTALKINLINNETHRKLRVRIDRYSFRKRCAIDVHSGFRGRIGLRKVLLSAYFNPREKFYLLRKGLISRIRGRA
jgi:glycosyltransferase involved in cell wall biosynthesis